MQNESAQKMIESIATKYGFKCRFYLDNDHSDSCKISVCVLLNRNGQYPIQFGEINYYISRDEAPKVYVHAVMNEQRMCLKTIKLVSNDTMLFMRFVKQISSQRVLDAFIKKTISKQYLKLPNHCCNNNFLTKYTEITEDNASQIISNLHKYALSLKDPSKPQCIVKIQIPTIRKHRNRTISEMVLEIRLENRAIFKFDNTLISKKDLIQKLRGNWVSNKEIWKKEVNI